tara:strand:- start:487 stop:1065 length:579 start_codon:yes stop_codon:yes gene_type:complete
MNKNSNNNTQWLEDYFDLYKKSLFDNKIFESLTMLSNEWQKTSSEGRKVIFMGNGGSAAMASHCAVDLSKNADIRAVNFNEADLITCLANDYGYENWMSAALGMYADKSDHVVLISSSGSSPNIINAAKKAKKMGVYISTFSGFKPNNPLRSSGDLNFYVNSEAYNIVEMTHHIWILAAVDKIIGSAFYSAN